MNEKTVRRVGFREINKIYQANCAVYQAKTENEIIQAIQGSLQSCTFITAYYKVTENWLVLTNSFNPFTQKTIEIAPDHIEITHENLEKYASPEICITSLETSSLPDSCNTFLIGLGCDQLVVLPIIQNGGVHGLLLVASFPNQVLSTEIIEPLKQLTELISIALNNLTTAQSTNQKLKELETLAEISQSISSSNDLDSLYKTLHAQINVTIGNVDFAVAHYNSQNETIELPYVSEGRESKFIDPFPLGEGVISVLIRTGQPLLLVVDAERQLNALGAKVVGRQAKSWLGCPLIVASGAIGALIVQDLDNEQRFNQDDLRFLITLSSQAAGKINNLHLLDGIRRTALELRTVAEISREVSSSLIIDDLIRQAVTLLHERFNFYHAAVFLLDASSEYAVVREAAGEASLQLKRAAHNIAVGSKTIIGFVTYQKEIQVINNATNDPNFYASPFLPDTKAEACFPLKVSERILGVLDVQSQRPYVFSDENIKILKILADQLAIAVVNSELFSEAQERLSQYRLLHHIITATASATTIQDVLNSAVQGLQVTMGGDQISIMMADKEQKTLEVKSSIGYPNEESARLKVPFGVGVTGWVAAHRQSLRIGDTNKDSRYISVNPKVRSELAIPLVYRNEVLGILNVESSRLNAYSENDEEMLENLAGSLAAILTHSRLLDQYHHQVEREHLMSEITNKIRRTTSPALILSIAADEISKALNTRRTHVEISLQKIQQTGSPLPRDDQ